MRGDQIPWPCENMDKELRPSNVSDVGSKTKYDGFLVCRHDQLKGHHQILIWLKIFQWNIFFYWKMLFHQNFFNFFQGNVNVMKCHFGKKKSFDTFGTEYFIASFPNGFFVCLDVYIKTKTKH